MDEDNKLTTSLLQDTESTSASAAAEFDGISPPARLSTLVTNDPPVFLDERFSNFTSSDSQATDPPVFLSDNSHSQAENQSPIETSERIIGDGPAKGGKLRYFDAVMILCTFNTSGSIILIPWSYGQLGYIIGPLTHIAIVGLVLFFNCFLVDVALASKEKIQTLGDIGHELAGAFGRRLFLSLQMVNMILYIPVALETIAVSMQYISGYSLGACIGYWNLISFGICLVLLQIVTEWKHAAWIASLTTAIAAVNAYGLLPYAIVEYQDDVIASDSYLGPALAAGSPQNNWHDLALAVSAFSYTFAPSFILIEVMSGVKDKHAYKSALLTSSAIQVSFYLVVGLVCVLLWGWNVEDPITLQIPDGWVGLLTSAILAVAVILDYLIASKVLNDWVQISIFPRWHYFGITLLTSGIALVMVIAIPNLLTFVGLGFSVVVIASNTWAVSLAWIRGGKRVMIDTTAQKSGSLHAWFMYLAGALCVPYTVWVMTAFIYEIATADYSSKNFFCEGY